MTVFKYTRLVSSVYRIRRIEIIKLRLVTHVWLVSSVSGVNSGRSMANDFLDIG